MPKLSDLKKKVIIDENGFTEGISETEFLRQKKDGKSVSLVEKYPSKEKDDKDAYQSPRGEVVEFESHTDPKPSKSVRTKLKGRKYLLMAVKVYIQAYEGKAVPGAGSMIIINKMKKLKKRLELK